MALPNVPIASAVWVLGGFYLHEAGVLCPAGLLASDWTLTGRVSEEMTQHFKVKQRVKSPYIIEGYRKKSDVCIQCEP